MATHSCSICGRELAETEARLYLGGQHICVACADRISSVRVPAPSVPTVPPSEASPPETAETKAAAVTLEEPAPAWDPPPAPELSPDPVDDDPLAAAAASVRRPPARGRIYRSPSKTRSNKVLPYIVVHGLLIGILAYLWLSGTFARWMNPSAVKDVVAVNEAEQYVDQHRLNELIREGNDLKARGALGAAKEKFLAARAIAEKSTSPSVQAQLADIDRALRTISQAQPTQVPPRARPIQSEPPPPDEPPPPPVTPGPPTSDPPEKPMTVTTNPPPVDRNLPNPKDWLKSTEADQLALSGWLALRAEIRDASLACQLFERSLLKKSKNDDALHGLALAKYLRDDILAANKDFDRLEKAARTDAAIAVNCAAARIVKEPSRAARVLADYLQGQERPDEQILNYFGLALARAHAAGINPDLLAPLRDRYTKFEGVLYSARTSGERRWGKVWLTADEVERRRNALAEADQNVKVQTDNLKNVQVELAKLEQGFKDAMDKHDVPEKQRAKKEAFDKAIAAANESVANKTISLEAAKSVLARTESPPWDERIEPVIPAHRLPLKS